MNYRRYAFCIGSNGPQSQYYSTLEYAEKDAYTLSNIFKSSPCNFVTTEAVIAVSYHETLSHLSRFLKQCESPDLFIVHFSGHAIYDESLYLICNETKYDDLVTSAIKIDTIKTILSHSPARYNILILDCCHAAGSHSGAFKGDFDLQDAIDRALQGSANVIVSACARSERTRELSTLNGGSGLLTWLFVTASTTSFKDVSRDGYSLALSDIVRWIPKYVQTINSSLAEEEQLPLPSILSETRGGDGEIWLTEPREFVSSTNIQSNLHDKRQRLNAMLVDHTNFLRNRLESFVGRSEELLNIQQYIQAKMETGGYVAITGDAGQGKSSIIAKLIENNGIEQTVFHFIPINPGHNHQVVLLHNIMARLILKYDLSNIYIISETFSPSHEALLKVLAEIIVKNGQEVIYIDGLDQLEEASNGVRDLNFLPPELPKGIVFVLGVRPNDTLGSLELLKQHVKYSLPSINRNDFDLILSHHEVTLGQGIADRFFEAMNNRQDKQGNALYLDLLAQELTLNNTILSSEITKIVQRIDDNPENIFSLSMIRLGRKKDPSPRWHKIIKPILGVLLVVREAIMKQHIRKIIEVDADRLHDGLERLGGLLFNDKQEKYSLFHLKFADYLLLDETRSKKDYIFDFEDRRLWHQKLASWCEQPNIENIWTNEKYDRVEQERRLYARLHYITHLYHAQQWKKLFQILDLGQYGMEKLLYDSSMRSYTKDLELGQRAASRGEWTFEDALGYLPNLWRYTLLHTSLTERADSYPIEKFEALVKQNRLREAIEMVELLTDSRHKIRVLLRIAHQLSQQPNKEREKLQILIRTREIAQNVESMLTRFDLYCDIGSVFPQKEYQDFTKIVWIEAESLALNSRWKKQQDGMLQRLEQLLVQAEQWERAEMVASLIDDGEDKALALQQLSHTLVQTQEWEYAKTILTKAEVATYEIENSDRKARILHELILTLLQIQEWDRALRLIHALEDTEVKADALRMLGQALTKAMQQEHAQAIWTQAEAVAQTLSESEARLVALRKLWQALVHAEQWERADVIWMHIESRALAINDDQAKLTVLFELHEELIQLQLWDKAKAQLDKIVAIISTLDENWTKAEILRELSLLELQMSQWDKADVTWSKSEALTSFLKVGVEKHIWAFGELQRALEEMQKEKIQQKEQIELVRKEREHFISILKKNLAQRMQAIQKYCKLLIHAQQWERAELLLQRLEGNEVKVDLLCELGQILMQAQLQNYADQVWKRTEEVVIAFKDGKERTEAFIKLIHSLIQAKQWRYAEALVNNIEELQKKVEVLGELGRSLTTAKQWVQAENVWRHVEATISSISDISIKPLAMRKLIEILLQVQQWERAKKLIHTIDDSIETRLDDEEDSFDEEDDEKIAILLQKRERLLYGQQIEFDERIWNDVELIEQSFENNDIQTVEREYLLRRLDRSELRQIYREKTAKSINILEKRKIKLSLLRELANSLVQAQEWKQAEIVWAEVEAIKRSYKESWERAIVLRELGKALEQAKEHDKAKPIWAEAIVVIHSIENSSMRGRAIRELLEILLQEMLWEETENLAFSLKEEREKMLVLHQLSNALIQARQPEYAARVLDNIKESREKAFSLLKLVRIFVEEQQWRQAEMTLENAKITILAIKNDEERLDLLFQLTETLFQAGKREQAENTWEIAMKIVQTLKDLRKKIVLLHKLWKILAQADQLEQIRARIYRVKDRQERALALSELAHVLASKDLMKQAESLFIEAEMVIRTIKSRGQKAEALHDITKILVQVGLFERAESVARSIEVKEERALALRELSEAQIQKNQLSPAAIIASSIEKEQHNSQTLDKLSIALAQHQQWPEAEWMAKAIEDPHLRIAALSRLVKMLIEVRQWDRAEIVVRAIEPLNERAIHLGLLAEKQEEKKMKALLIEAEEISLVLKDRYEKARTLKEIGCILTRCEQFQWANKIWMEAIGVANSIWDDKHRTETLRELGVVLAQACQWELAARSTRLIEIKEERTIVLCSLTEALALAQRWKQAKAIALAIKDKDKKVEALLRLSNKLASAQQWEQAMSIAEMIDSQELKSNAFLNLSEEMIKSQRWEQAAEIVLALKPSRKRIEALRSLSSQLKSVGAFDTLLYLIQRSWLQATTRGEALILLPFAYDLISLKPEIGTAFYEAIEWVEKSLAY